MSDTDSTPEQTIGNVEGDVNVGTESETAPESTESEGTSAGDTDGDEAQQDTGALQE